ncbi:MAG: hypothetical protein IIB17_11505 [Chloroflexi bacterium]|nr:hypothetical protein [Chloroflexota bacterium]
MADYKTEQIDAARRLYSSSLGIKVLAHMVGQMGFFDTTDTPQEMVLKNFATEYMASLGFSQDNATSLTEMIMKLPGKKETQDG